MQLWSNTEIVFKSYLSACKTAHFCKSGILVCFCVLKAPICLDRIPPRLRQHKSKVGVTLIWVWLCSVWIHVTISHTRKNHFRFLPWTVSESKKKRVFKNYLCLFVSRHSGSSLEENYFQRISLSYSTPATWQSTMKTVHFWLMKNGEENKQVEKKSHLQRKSREGNVKCNK